jgi:selenocysteine-specific elongation factor
MVSATVDTLAVLERGEPVEMVELYLRDAGVAGINTRELSILTNINEKQVRSHLQDLMSRGEAIKFDREGQRSVHKDVLSGLTQLVGDQLEAFHQREPLRAGMSKEELFVRMPRGVGTKLFNELIQRMARQDDIVQEKDLVRRSSHQVALAGEQEKMRQGIESIYRQAGLQPPFFREVTQSLGVSDGEARKILNWMLEQAVLVKVKEDMFFHHQNLGDLKGRLREFFREHEEISTPEFKELTQTTRKYTIPLLEFLDASRFTIRVGDSRRLRQSKN